ncbi:MAG: hypothetical protein V7K67_02895 [Nostoc sp.]
MNFVSAAKPLSSPLALASPNVIRGDAKSDSAGGKRVIERHERHFEF